MSGYVFVGEEPVPNAFVPDGKLLQVRYFTCRLCLGEGVVTDRNGEPERFCTCATGEAVKQASAA